MPSSFPSLVLPKRGARGAPKLGHRLVDAYLRLVAARLRPNSTLAVAYDLKVFFSVVAVDPVEVRRRHVVAFIRAQRTGSVDATVVPVVRSRPERGSFAAFRCRDHVTPDGLRVQSRRDTGGIHVR